MFLSDHAQGLFAVQTSSTPELFFDDRPASGLKQISDSHLWFAAMPLKLAAALMVWDDGQQFINRDSASIRLLDLIDNLTYEKRLPVIVWVFPMPGIATMPEGLPFYQAVQKAAKADTQTARTAALRGVEYETLSDQYARFLKDDLLAEVQSKYNIRKDSYSRAIAGLSSGALGAFTAAWEQPKQLSRVLLWVTPFTSGRWEPGIRNGGNIYPLKIRKE